MVDMHYLLPIRLHFSSTIFMMAKEHYFTSPSVNNYYEYVNVGVIQNLRVLFMLFKTEKSSIDFWLGAYSSSWVVSAYWDRGNR